MNEDSRKIILEYKTQIIVLLFSIIAIIISIIVINDLIKIEKGDSNIDTNKVTKKSELSSLLFLLTSLFFAYTTYKNYIKNKTKSNFLYLIAVLLALIAATIRYITLKKENSIQGVDDVVL